MVAVVTTLVVVLVLIAALLLTRKDGDTGSQVSSGDRPNGRTQGDGAPSTSMTTTSSTTTSTTVPTTAASTTTLPGQGDVLSEPPGLLCASLAHKGYDYRAAVTYWRAQGQPARMDVDGNGRPCETVYPPSAVRAFWHT